MPSNWTTEQVVALSPDASSTKAGRDLANPRKWVTLGQNEQAAWGECQGSGKLPYQTEIDLSGPGFQCSCPSRKFPCKHALGLFFLLVEKPASLTQTDPPDWVEKWLAGRAARAEQKAKKQESDTPAAPDPKAQAKRAAERTAKVTAGLQELELWLGDLVRRGLASAQSEGPAFWEKTARRMVDAQAPGAARLVREMAPLPSTGPGWQARLLRHMGRLHLMLEGYKRLDALPEETQADIRTLIGWSQPQEEVLAQAGVRDVWRVLGQCVEEEERLRVQRTWLWGAESGRAALVFSFAPTGQPLDTSLVPGSEVDASLAFFAGSYPLRALVKERHAPAASVSAMPGYPSIEAGFAAYASALARFPWLERFPITLAEVVPLVEGDAWVLRDAGGSLLPLAPRFPRTWELLALSGGHPVSLFGEWDGEFLLPMGLWAEGRYRNA